MNWKWLQIALSESTTWLGIAAFFGGVGGFLSTGGLSTAGLIVASIGMGAGGVGAFITREQKPPQGPAA